MQTIVLIVHLILALSLMGVVLLQRSEGGGLGIGGGMGPQGGRPPLTGLAKLTWGFATAFIITSLTLTVIAASDSAETSVLDRLGLTNTPATPNVQLPDVQLPPAGDGPVLPPAGDSPALPPVTLPEVTLPTEAPVLPPASDAPVDAPAETPAPAPVDAPVTPPVGN